MLCLPLSPRIAAFCADASLRAHAAELAARAGLPMTTDITDWDLLLIFKATDNAPGYHVALQQTGANAPGPVDVEFVGGRSGYRRRMAEGRRQPLARAAGLKHAVNPVVLDATGGLGRDAFVFATLGCRVQVVERSPVVAMLLHNGLERARADATTAPIAARMTLINEDARGFLRTLNGVHRPDIIYLDPMYPQRDKSALVKKEMRVLRALLGDDHDAAELLTDARRCARQRVIVKRPRRSPWLGESKPGMSIESENTRYDVYPAPAARI